MGIGHGARPWEIEKKTDSWIEVSIPRIIEDDLIDRAAAMRKSRRNGRRRNSRLLLQGRVFCGRCGTRMARGNNGPKGIAVHVCEHRNRRYRDRPKERCAAPRLHADMVLEAAIKAAVQALRSPASTQRLAMGAIKSMRRRLAEHYRWVELAVKNIERLREERRRLALTYRHALIL